MNNWRIVNGYIDKDHEIIIFAGYMMWQSHYYKENDHEKNIITDPDGDVYGAGRTYIGCQ